MKDELRNKIYDIRKKSLHSKEVFKHTYNTDDFGFEIKIISSKYANEIRISHNAEEILEFIEKNNISNEDYYLEISRINSEVINSEKIKNIIEFIEKIPTDVSIIIKDLELNNHLKLEEYSNIFFHSAGEIDFEILYDIVKNNSAYFQSVDAPTIVINGISNDILSKMEVIDGYFSKEDYREPLKYKIMVRNKYDLVNLNVITPQLNNDHVEIYLDANIFSQEEVNINSSRYLIRDNKALEKLLQQTSENLNCTFYYAGVKFYNIDEIIDFEKNLDVLYSRIPKSSSELDKTTFITLFMLNYFNYCDDDKIRASFDFLKDGKGVCIDYAAFFKHIMTNLNIHCEMIISFPKNEEEGHAFNVIIINGIKYFIDVTWIAGQFENGEVSSIEESEYYLASNEKFEHNKYLVNSNLICEEFNRYEIKNSVERVLGWKDNYSISFGALKDLIKRKMGIAPEMAEFIIAAMPSLETNKRR